MIINLDFSDDKIEMAMDSVYLYLSNKQPLPLQVKQTQLLFNWLKKIFFQQAAIGFYRTLSLYDEELVKKHLEANKLPDCKPNTIFLLENCK